MNVFDKENCLSSSCTVWSESQHKALKGHVYVDNSAALTIRLASLFTSMRPLCWHGGVGPGLAFVKTHLGLPSVGQSKIKLSAL